MEWCTVAEAARIFRLRLSTLYRWIELERLTVRAGERGMMVRLGEVDQLVQIWRSNGRYVASRSRRGA